MSLLCLLYCIISNRESAVIFFFIPLYILTFEAQFLTSSFIFVSQKYDFAVPWYSFLLGSWASWIYVFSCFHQIWGSFGHYFLKYPPIYDISGALITDTLDCLILFHLSLVLYSFKHNFFSLSFFFGYCDVFNSLIFFFWHA